MGNRRRTGTELHERFPTKPRSDGRFQKRIHGKLFYFGHDGDRKAALQEYEAQKKQLYDRSAPPVESPQGVEMTLGELVSRYVKHLEEENEAGRCSDQHLRQSVKVTARLLGFLGTGKLVSELCVDDFSRYGRHLTGKLGDYAYNRERAIVGAMFNHAVNHADWIERPVKIGKGFKKHSPATMREKKKKKLVEPRELVALLAHTAQFKPQMEAMLLLAANCGFGATDCCELQWSIVDLGGAIIRGYRRSKTKIDRDSPLWPETVEALRGLREAFPLSDRVFNTVRGCQWDGFAIAHELAKLVESFNEDRKAIGLEPIREVVLGDLRHTCATYASEARDSDAWKRIMGHTLPGLKSVYVETIFVPRLKALVDHIRSRLILAAGQEEQKDQPPIHLARDY